MGIVAPWSSAEIARLLRDELKDKFGIELKATRIGNSRPSKKI
jgi:hypothetical protein